MKPQSKKESDLKIEDIRPDIKEDSSIWTIVLKTAIFYKDDTFYNTLKGFRSAGCRLELNDEAKTLSFNFGEEANDEEKDIIKSHAKIHKDRIISLFKKVYEAIKKAK